MTYASNASSALATCYPLTCNPEEYASDLFATQKRREDIKATQPSQAEGLKPASTIDIVLRLYQANAVQHSRITVEGEAWI